MQAVCIGGGYIGMECAAVLALNGLDVTMVFPEDRCVCRAAAGGFCCQCCLCCFRCSHALERTLACLPACLPARPPAG